MKNNFDHRLLKISFFFALNIFAQSIFAEKSDVFERIQNLNRHNPNKQLKLHLGCGESHLEGYVNIDYPSFEHTVQTVSAADIFADIVTLAMPAESVDEIRSHHVFEHFDRQTALALLCNWHQQLKIGGSLIIETPDFMKSAELILLDNSLSYREKQAVLRHIFGSHEARWAIHCDGWYEEKFLHVLTSLGFSDIQVQHSRYLNLCNITITAKKLSSSDHYLIFNKAKEILRESLVAECETKMYAVWCSQLEHLIIGKK